MWSVLLLCSVCKSVNNDDILNNLRDILLNFSSIWNWVKGNWYYVLAGSVAVGKPRPRGKGGGGVWLWEELKTKLFKCSDIKMVPHF